MFGLFSGGNGIRLLGGRGLFVALLVTTAFGCSSVPERHPVPPELTNQAGIPGVPDARFWGDEWPEYSRDLLMNSTASELQHHFSGIYNKPHNYLAISGGGSQGAFGAGLLVGWAEAGTRPEFTMVTGVSTGALTAPFAFLGARYDDQLKEVYTTTSTNQIARERSFVFSIFSDAIADTTPLRELIARYFDEDVIEEIAHEHKRGRRLFIGTQNLDASRSVIWNIGAIAASDNPRKVELIHDVLVASSAIPVAFPPVLIPVDANALSYDEMHVDGGTGSQVFVYPAEIDWKIITKKLEVRGKPQVFVIRNAILEPDYHGVRPNILPIGKRTISSLIRTQGIGDLYQIFALSKRDGNVFNLAYIPSDFTDTPSQEFDPVYMSKLFELGRKMAIDGYPWKKSPPGFIEATGN